MTDHSTDEIIEELRQIWVEASEETISRDLARAQALVDTLSPEGQAVAAEFIGALRRLEHWLRDH